MRLTGRARTLTTFNQRGNPVLLQSRGGVMVEVSRYLYLLFRLAKENVESIYLRRDVESRWAAVHRLKVISAEPHLTFE